MIVEYIQYTPHPKSKIMRNFNNDMDHNVSADGRTRQTAPYDIIQ